MGGEIPTKVVLLGFFASMFGMRVRIALAEKKVKYEYIEEVGLVTNKSQFLLQMNPIHKKVPVLIIDGKPICESLIIVQYIYEVWNDDDRPLFPSDPYQRSQAKFWGDYMDKKLFDAGVKVWATKEEAAQEVAKKEFIEIYKTLEGVLGDEPFFGGEEFGYLDLAFIPFSAWFYTYETCGHFKIETHCPKIIAWVHRCMQRDTAAKSLYDPLKVYDFALLLRKMWGID